MPARINRHPPNNTAPGNKPVINLQLAVLPSGFLIGSWPDLILAAA